MLDKGFSYGMQIWEKPAVPLPAIMEYSYIVHTPDIIVLSYTTEAIGVADLVSLGWPVIPYL